MAHMGIIGRRQKLAVFLEPEKLHDPKPYSLSPKLVLSNCHASLTRPGRAPLVHTGVSQNRVVWVGV